MKARTLIATALVLAACGDASVSGAGPAATTPSTVAPAPPATTVAITTTTTTPPPERAPGGPGELFEEIAGRNGWSIPAVAFPDFAADACSRAVWEPAGAFAFGESLLFDDFLDWRITSYDRATTAQAARLGWALAAMTCPDRFPPAALAAGPPELADYPACDLLGWRPYELPWTAVPGPADRVAALDDGTLELAWDGPAGEAFWISFGRGERWADVTARGELLTKFGTGERGPVRRGGFDARVVAGAGTLSVAWESGPEFCSASVASLDPAPAADPVAVMAGIVLEPIARSINDAEVRMWGATLLLRGFDHIGGEPSHGGADAVHWMTDARGTGYFLYAIPVERFPSLGRSGEWTEVLDDEAAGHPVTVLIPPHGDGLTARTVVDGFVLEVTADLGIDALIAFTTTWVDAWQAAAP